MFNLIVRNLKDYRDEFPLEGQVIVVGRGDNVHIKLDSTKISRKHFRIIIKGLKLYIEDLNSSNGTFLNEEPLNKITPITENDIIRFGDFYAQLNNTNKIKKNFKIDEIVDAIIEERRKKSEKPYYKLVSKDKRYPGLSFLIEEGITTLGRTPVSNIVVPDQTLSKKHLKIDRRGKKLYLEDMGSVNGTRVNGRKLRQKRQVFDGDKIEIGDVKFEIASNIELPKPKKSKKKLIIILAALFMMLLLAVMLKPKKKKPKKVIKIVTLEEEIESKEKERERLIAKSQRYANKALWDEAIRTCNQVLKEDPANLNAQKYKNRYLKEKEYKKYFDKGKEALDILNYEDAIEYLKKIPKNTYYREKARLYIREAKEALKSKYYSEAKVYYRARRYRAAYETLRKLFSITAYHSEALELKVKLEKKMKYYRIKFKKFNIKLNDISVDNKGNIRDKIKKVYPEKELATPLEYYVNGDIEYAIKYLNRVSVTNKNYAKSRPLLKALINIKTKYNVGNTYIVKKDYPKARSEWDKVLELDKQLLKGIDVESKYAKMIKTHLSDGFYELGKKALKSRMYKSAFIKLNESLKYNPQNTYTLYELSKLKKLAENLWTESLQFEKAGDKRAFENWNKILEITLESDKLHKLALDKINNVSQ